MTKLFDSFPLHYNDLYLAPLRKQKLGNDVSSYQWCVDTFGEERVDADRYVSPSLRHELIGQWALINGRLYLTPDALALYLLRWA